MPNPAGSMIGVVAGTSAVKVVDFNPSRQSITITNNGAGNIWLYMGGPGPVTYGILVKPGGGISWDRSDPMPHEVWAISDIASCPLGVMEMSAYG